MVWFKRGLPPHQTALAMIGARAGEGVLFMGAGAPALAAEVARLTGLNGRTLVVDSDAAARDRAERAAAEAGALVEVGERAALAGAGEAFDIAVIVADAESIPALARTAADACRALRPGGRVIVRLAARRGGLFAARAHPPESIVEDLRASGAVAARHLADADGVSYFEARKSRTE